MQRVRKLVKVADTGGIDEEPLAWALEVMAVGTPFLVDSDHEACEKEFPVYDAVYTYFKQQIIREKFKEEIAKIKTRPERHEFIKKITQRISMTDKIDKKGVKNLKITSFALSHGYQTLTIKIIPFDLLSAY